jgi:Helix-turn-helix
MDTFGPLSRCPHLLEFGLHVLFPHKHPLKLRRQCQAQSCAHTFFSACIWPLKWYAYVHMCEPMVEHAIERLGSVPEAARKLGVSKSTLYMILRGERTPSDKLLEQLGLARVELITRAK